MGVNSLSKWLMTMVHILAVYALPFASTASYYTECHHAELSRCAQPLHIINDANELTFATSKQELEDHCLKLKRGVQCIQSFTRRCMDIKQREHFNRLYSGTLKIIRNLCEDGPYQDEYLRHAPCMHLAVDGFETCTKRFQTTMDSIKTSVNASKEEAEQMAIRKVCCSFQEYKHCSVNVMHERCGRATAEFTRTFLSSLTETLNETHCSGFTINSHRCDIGLLNASSLALVSNNTLALGVLLSVLALFNWQFSIFSSSRQ